MQITRLFKLKRFTFFSIASMIIASALIIVGLYAALFQGDPGGYVVAGVAAALIATILWIY